MKERPGPQRQHHPDLVRAEFWHTMFRQGVLLRQHLR
jgi:hypothetical protein